MVLERYSYSNVSGNASLVFEPGIAQVYISAIQAVVIFVGSSLALTAFASLPALRTPFNYYLISILLAELFLAIYQGIFAIQEYYGHWVFSKRACTLFAFMFFASEGIVGNAHFLISVNRTWALFFPHHYRTRNSKGVTLFLCAGVWIATVILVLPWAILNEQHLVEPIIVCRVQTYDQFGFSILVMVLFVSPTTFILVIYPLLYSKYRARTKARVGVTGHDQTTHRASTAASRRNVTVFTVDQTVQSTDPRDGEGKESLKSHNRSYRGPRITRCFTSRPGFSRIGQRKLKSSNFLVLSWVAFCATIFWAPNVIYAVTEVFVHPNLWFNNKAFAGLCAWLACSTLLDPIMFITTVPLLRSQVKKILRL
ncbi:hypothetical protein RvY_16750 [Ramazzottius varieornatus]|uniref:G-protein coupled receptors family 1 profile domain-containing protein n=1 Tax=Ramazzottius varieornatus TaxID=947166 RepID=A0A1D1W6Y9_RAMVA|nr:hypothetical protein RvY_16750 [Ramazzottius varieornatus]